ncbi:MAG: isocitrate/isopropylmalate family dehydrogenase [Promethearchaeota archaeon]
MNDETRAAVEAAAEHFKALLEEQLARVEKLKKSEEWIDYSATRPLVVGVVGGDGIGPYICEQARRVLEYLLADELRTGDVEIREVQGLTIERRAEVGKAIPDDVMEQLKRCHVILKGPTTTPREGDPWPNLESANVAMRRELDLFANVRPVRVPRLGIDWVFFRENTEGAYVLGSRGVHVTDDLAVDFKVITTQGTERIVRLAFEHARRTGAPKVTVVTKANVVKATDGKFLEVAKLVAAEYPDVGLDDWYVDIMTAKLIDPARQRDFRVIVAPNLYGDILTDEAAQLQGGVGTAGSANVGKRYAMFEAIHGSAPRMVKEGRAKYADPSSMLKAASMLLAHAGYVEKARLLDAALDVCCLFERKLRVTGRPNGATGEEFADYVVETLKDPALLEKWSARATGAP